MTTDTDPPGADAADRAAEVAELARFVATARAALDAVLPAVLAALDAAWPRADALACHEVEGVPVAVATRRDGLALGLYADAGLPEDGDVEAALRLALERNHQGTHPLIRYGLHPGSGRLVAHALLPTPWLAGDAGLAVDCAAELARAAQALAAEAGLDKAD